MGSRLARCEVVNWRVGESFSENGAKNRGKGGEKGRNLYN